MKYYITETFAQRSFSGHNFQNLSPINSIIRLILNFMEKNQKNNQNNTKKDQQQKKKKKKRKEKNY